MEKIRILHSGTLNWKQLVKRQKRLFLQFIFELLNSDFLCFFQKTKITVSDNKRVKR